MILKNSCALAVFARAAAAGEVKTRLAQTLQNGDCVVDFEGEAAKNEAAAQLYRAMLCDVLALGEAAMKNRTDEALMGIFFTPDDAFERADNSLAEFWDGARRPQKGGDLGARLYDCFGALRREGWERVVVIGSDAPDLPPHLLREAFEKLAHCDVVFGPSRDGGFYLMGASCSLPPSLLLDVRWSDENTLHDVLRHAEARSLEVGLLAPWSDIDTRDDVIALRARLQSGQSAATSTNRVLDTWQFEG